MKSNSTRLLFILILRVGCLRLIITIQKTVELMEKDYLR